MTGNQGGPSPDAILERSRSLANETMWTIALQDRRLGTTEPEDHEFVFRWWADLQFLIVALRRLRRIAVLASHVPSAATDIEDRIDRFDAALPGLNVMRNVGEHVDSYALDDPARHHREGDRQALQVGSWDGRTFTWLIDQKKAPLRLDVLDCRTAAEGLTGVIRAVCVKPSVKSSLRQPHESDKLA